MKKQSYDILIDLYKKFKTQEEDALSYIKYYNGKILEVESFLDSIHDKEDENYNMFSPRKVESEFKYQVEESDKEKQNYKNKVEYYEARYKEVKEYRYQLERILKIEELKK